MSSVVTVGQLEEQKAAMLKLVAAWPLELVPVCPRPGEWSVLQVLDHLVRTEAGITALAREGMLSPSPIGARDRLGFLFVERVFRTNRRVKVPAGAPVLPGDGLELGEVVARWDNAREMLAAVIRDSPESYDGKGGVFRHPVSGWMTLDQVLRFFSVHMVHHEFQLERIRRGLSARSASARTA